MQVDKNAALVARWYYCAVTQEKLSRPVVSCDLGRLYNKDAITEYLLHKSAERPNMEVAVHIRGIKLNLTDNPAWQGDSGNTKGVDKNAALVARWYYCAVTQEKLSRPVVSCDLGRLYNKDAITEYLLHKSAERPNMEVAVHIRGIKPGRETAGTPRGGHYEDLHRACYICLVVGLEMNGKHKFCYLQTCGCMFSERAVWEVKTETCHKFGDPFQNSDIVIRNGSKEEVEELRKGMEEVRAKEKLGKTVEDECVLALSAPEPSSSTAVSIKPVATAGSKRLFSGRDEKSEAYKSLFTSHSSAKRTKEQMSNWVTHTPYHF
ncbi:RTF2 protein, partial [Polyodon spathula]|nr:RTF2 protein [Polyodon spathula]